MQIKNYVLLFRYPFVSKTKEQAYKLAEENYKHLPWFLRKTPFFIIAAYHYLS